MTIEGHENEKEEAITRLLQEILAAGDCLPGDDWDQIYELAEKITLLSAIDEAKKVCSK